MVGYHLKNTFSEFGTVSRGICDTDKNKNLKKIVETTKILKKDNKIISVQEDGSEKLLTGNEIASMNMRGFKPSIFKMLENKFIDFLKTEINKLKSEKYFRL